MVQIDYLVQAELYRTAVEQGPDAIIVVDRTGSIIVVNEQAELLTGRTRKEMIGQKIETLVPAERRGRHREHRSVFMGNPRRRLMGPGLELAILQQTEDGEVAIPVEVNLAPVPISSLGVVVIVTIRRPEESRWSD